MRGIAATLLLLVGVLGGCVAGEPVKPGSPLGMPRAASISPISVPAAAGDGGVSSTAVEDVEGAAGCAVTEPNGSTPPGEQPSARHHGAGQLWTVLWPEGTVRVEADQVMEDGRLGMKFPWWRGVVGELSISGRRLDAPAPPLEAEVNDGYGESGFQASALFFPSAGCWEVTGRVGEHALTFVTRVEVAGT